MIIEISFGLVGGLNFGLEKSLDLIKNITIKYPHAVWKRVVNRKKGVGKYIVEID
jgi:hypothetical protein